MKKTLAAVLAAAMALSTATVALAVDHDADLSSNSNGTDGGNILTTFDKDIVVNITSFDNLTQGEIADLYDEGYISISAIVTDGASNLAGKPSVSLVKMAKDKTGTFTKGYSYTWVAPDFDLKLDDGTSIKFRQTEPLPAKAGRFKMLLKQPKAA